MSEYFPKADRAVAEFLTEHPEHEAEFGYHKELGPVMSTLGVDLFVDWAVKKGRIKPGKAARAKGIMHAINKIREGGQP